MVQRALRIRIGLDNITVLERHLRHFELSDDEWNVLTGIKEFLRVNVQKLNFPVFPENDIFSFFFS